MTFSPSFHRTLFTNPRAPDCLAHCLYLFRHLQDPRTIPQLLVVGACIHVLLHHRSLDYSRFRLGLYLPRCRKRHSNTLHLDSH
jgi:hypothetical protein